MTTVQRKRIAHLQGVGTISIRSAREPYEAFKQRLDQRFGELELLTIKGEVFTYRRKAQASAMVGNWMTTEELAELLDAEEREQQLHVIPDEPAKPGGKPKTVIVQDWLASMDEDDKEALAERAWAATKHISNL